MIGQELTTQEQDTLHAKSLFHLQLALDATTHSNQVIEQLQYYISPKQTVCHFVHVLPGATEHDQEFAAMDNEAQAERERVINNLFDNYTQVLSEQQFLVEDRHFIKDIDSIEAGILSYLEHQPCSLLALGMHDPLQRDNGWRISSTSYATATHAKCPVIVIKKPLNTPPKLRILFATDGSQYAEKAALKLARFLPKETAEITLFTAISINYYVMPVVEPFIDYSPLERAMKGDAQKLLNRTAALFKQTGHTVSDSYFNIGDPVDQILAEADEKDFDLIVMGAHGTTGRLTKWLLGSVSSKVLEYSNASVAILR